MPATEGLGSGALTHQVVISRDVATHEMVADHSHRFVSAVAVLAVHALVLFDETKPFMERYGNHASVIGLLVSVVGFVLTCAQSWRRFA